jgi:uncharacterized protein (DUF1499 family)
MQSDSDRILNWCPPLPNCVSTEASTFVHRIAAFPLALPIEQAWPVIVDNVNQLPRTNIEHTYDGYIYAKSYSKLLGFVDYLEILYQEENATLNVRSGSLLGISDLNVNFQRTEALRQLLIDSKVISP